MHNPKNIEMLIKKFFVRIEIISLLIILIALIVRCEGKDKFIRPNLSEELCSIGIIDVDDTVRYISFEKSYQSEYIDEITDSLRGLTFSIYSKSKSIYFYKADSTIKNVENLKIPDTIDFTSGETCYLSASEKKVNSISAEAIVPQKPSDLELISFNKEIIKISDPKECSISASVKSVEITFSFDNYMKDEEYFAVLVVGSGFSFSSSYVPSYSSFLDFSVRSCNTPGFLSIMHGIIMYHKMCKNGFYHTEKSPVFAYFMEGKKIPNNKCQITLYTQFQDSYAVYDALKTLKIKLMSIPKPLYLFEKSLYTYKQTVNDPFTEPIYLNGNIIGGNGVFALCRSSELSISLSPLF